MRGLPGPLGLSKVPATTPVTSDLEPEAPRCRSPPRHSRESSRGRSERERRERRSVPRWRGESDGTRPRLWLPLRMLRWYEPSVEEQRHCQQRRKEGGERWTESEKSRGERQRGRERVFSFIYSITSELIIFISYNILSIMMQERDRDNLR